MAKYVTPDGEEYDVDTPDDPQVKAWIASVNAEPKALRLGKLIPAKVAEGMVKLPFVGSDLLNFGLDVTEKQFSPEWMKGEGYQDFRQAHKGSGWVDEGVKALGGEIPQPRNQTEKYLSSAAGGLGGALGGGGIQALLKQATPNTVKAALPMLGAQGVGGGIGAEFGSQITDGNPLGALLGGLAGGVAPMALKGIPGQNNPFKAPSQGEKLLSGAARTVPPGEFSDAQKNLGILQNAGSNTFSLADAFPEQNQIRSLADIAQATPQGANLAQRTAGREADIAGITKRALDAVAPGNPSPTGVSLEVAKAAAARQEQLRNAKNSAFTQTLAKAKPVPYNMVEALRGELLNRSKQPNIEDSMRAAYVEMADALLDPNQNVKSSGILVPGPNGTMVPKPDTVGLKTSPQTISSEINTRRQTMTSPNAPPGKSIPTAAWAKAQKDFDELFRKVVPEYGKAMSDAALFNETVRTPMRQGPMGALAPNAMDPTRPVPVARLDNIIRDQSGMDVRQTLMDLDLGSQGPQGNMPAGNLSGQALRAALEKRLRESNTNPAQKLRGEAGSPTEQSLLEGIDFVGGDPKKFQQNLIATELLNKQRVPANTSALMEEARTSPMQAIAEPFGTTRRFIGKTNLDSAVREASAILAQPTPQNLQRLKELSTLYPEIRASVIRAGFGGMLVGQEQTREGK